MNDVVDDLCDSVAVFFSEAGELSPVQVAALLDRASRPVTRRSLDVDPTFLGAVCEGTWATPHDVAARRARESCRRLAGELAGRSDRRALAAALEEAALAAIATAGPRSVLPDDLVDRLSQQWRVALSVPAQRGPQRGDRA